MTKIAQIGKAVANRNTLKRFYKWPPYIFAHVQKMKIALQNVNAIKKSKALSRLCRLSHFKMTGRSCTDKVREKVPSFQKVTLLV